jgi:hypothetical protein
MFHKRLPLTKYNNENTSNERKIKNQNCKIKNGSPVLARILQNKTVGGPSAISQATDQPQEKTPPIANVLLPSIFLSFIAFYNYLFLQGLH